MKKLYCLLLFIGIALTIPTASAKPGFRKFYKKCDEFFASYVLNGKVNYTAIQGNRENLNYLVQFIADAKTEKLSQNELKAFYINSYNLLVISQVINLYPISSPYEVEGFFDKKQFIVGGQALTLNQIEEDVLLKKLRDIRSILALCSGTIGSFPIDNKAFKPSGLNKELAKRMEELANDESFVRIKKNSSKILCCESFIRCVRLAGQNEVITNLSGCRKDTLPISYALDYYPSNHSLNIVK